LKDQEARKNLSVTQEARLHRALFPQKPSGWAAMLQNGFGGVMYNIKNRPLRKVESSRGHGRKQLNIPPENRENTKGKQTRSDGKKKNLMTPLGKRQALGAQPGKQLRNIAGGDH